jgi:hypothetical protein
MDEVTATECDARNQAHAADIQAVMDRINGEFMKLICAMVEEQLGWPLSGEAWARVVSKEPDVFEEHRRKLDAERTKP